jgi:hypothetical protein
MSCIVMCMPLPASFSLFALCICNFIRLHVHCMRERERERERERSSTAWPFCSEGAFPPSHFCDKLDDKLARKVALVVTIWFATNFLLTNKTKMCDI